MIKLVKICDRCGKRFDGPTMHRGGIEGDFCSPKCVWSNEPLLVKA